MISENVDDDDDENLDDGATIREEEEEEMYSERHSKIHSLNLVEKREQKAMGQMQSKEKYNEGLSKIDKSGSSFNMMNRDNSIYQIELQNIDSSSQDKILYVSNINGQEYAEDLFIDEQ